ncbi:MAG: relaxase/mobilization nuclease domain-containing protein [Rhodobiaceae bacterium]|nr:relaxase/mobilization nuclease domain-containing protein [Rhodobiaceae bacterium]
MILKASQRSGSAQLARHLLNTRDNEHVEIHELRGFVSGTLDGAFKEAHAVSKGTRCTQFLFSLSLSPPEKENVPIAVFEKAIDEIEDRLGLTGQPRAVVFHEKEGRRHAHCVWSRINTGEMKAINLPHFKFRLRDMSRELFLEHGWHMPRGLLNTAERNPLNFSIAEWQQAKRIKQDPRVIKQIFQECWNRSDSQNAFANALKERGYVLAQGDRRGHVAVDWRGEVFAISKWVGVKAKDVRSRLAGPASLPSVEMARAAIADQYTDKLKEFISDEESGHSGATAILHRKRTEMAVAHRKARRALAERQRTRSIVENQERAARLPTGLKALWFRLTGKYRAVREDNERRYEACLARDRRERERLTAIQLSERRSLQDEVRIARQRHALRLTKLRRDIRSFLDLKDRGQNQREMPHRKKRRERHRG